MFDIDGNHCMCDQLSRVLCNEFTDTVSKCIVVDCRYPYEYDGGHIQVEKLILYSAVFCDIKYNSCCLLLLLFM